MPVFLFEKNLVLGCGLFSRRSLSYNFKHKPTINTYTLAALALCSQLFPCSFCSSSELNTITEKCQKTIAGKYAQIRHTVKLFNAGKHCSVVFI